MKSETISSTMMVICFLITIFLPFTSDNAHGGPLPDYDLEVNEDFVHVYWENGNIGSFSMTLINQCDDTTLTLNVNIETPGMSVSPMYSSVSIPPASSREITVAVSALLTTPAGIYPANIFTEVTHVNGVTATGIKERSASAVIILHRYQSLSVETQSASIGKGDTIPESITVNNSGNAMDYVALEFLDSGLVQGFPLKEFVAIPQGANVQYPVTIHASEKASSTDYPLRYRVHSLINEEAQAEGILNVEVGKESSQENGFSLKFFALVTATIILFWLILKPLRSFEKTINRSRRSSFPLFAHTFFIVFILTLPPPVSGFSGTITTDGDLELDPSPFTSDEVVTWVTWVTLESNIIYEQVARITVDSPGIRAGYSFEQRVPAMGQRQFPISFAIQKQQSPEMIPIEIRVQTIEREGVNIQDGTTIATNLRGTILSYAFADIQLDVEERDHQLHNPSHIIVKKGKTNDMGVTISDMGNAVDEYALHIVDRESLEDQGFEFTDFPDMGHHLGHFRFNVTPTSKLNGEFYVLKVLAQPNGSNEPVGGSTMLMIPEDSDEDDDDDDDISMEIVAGSIGTVVIVLVIIILVIIRKKRRAIMEEDSTGEEMEEEVEGTEGS